MNAAEILGGMEEKLSQGVDVDISKMPSLPLHKGNVKSAGNTSDLLCGLDLDALARSAARLSDSEGEDEMCAVSTSYSESLLGFLKSCVLAPFLLVFSSVFGRTCNLHSH